MSALESVLMSSCSSCSSSPAATQQDLSVTALKIAAQSEKAIVAVVEAADQNARALLPPGQGKAVDLST
jgi:Fe-S cluster biogenesis protein NfuA